MLARRRAAAANRHKLIRSRTIALKILLVRQAIVWIWKQYRGPVATPAGHFFRYLRTVR